MPVSLHEAIKPVAVSNSDGSEKAKPLSSPLPAPAQAFHKPCSSPSECCRGCGAEQRCPSLPQYIWEAASGTAQREPNPSQAPQSQNAINLKASPVPQVRFVSAQLPIPLQAQETNARLYMVPLPSRCQLFGAMSVLHLADTSVYKHIATATEASMEVLASNGKNRRNRHVTLTAGTAQSLVSSSFLSPESSSLVFSSNSC